MPTKNISSTRYYSNAQEEAVAKLIGAQRQTNSGASFDGLFAVIPESIYAADHINIVIREKYPVTPKDVVGCTVDTTGVETVLA